jgi:hypothetical protein
MTVPFSVYWMSDTLAREMVEITHCLSLVLVFDTSDSFTILDDLVDLGLLEDLDPIRGVLSEVFELTISERLEIRDAVRLTNLLHQSIGDGHSGELLSTTVSPLFTVSTKSRDFTEIEIEFLDQPVDCITGFVSENFDKVITGEFTCRLFGVGEAGVRCCSM